jgi:fatty acid desaturase
MLERLLKTNPRILWVWMFSAFISGIGLGALIAGYSGEWALWIFLVSIAVHLWTMYKIYLAR